MDWYDAPIPESDVIEGAPQTRSHDLHRAHRGGVTMNYWDCTAGRFRWHYAGDEMVQILEGEVHVTDETGRTTTLRTGDTAHFQAGTTLVWHVERYVRKLAFHRNPQTVSDRVISKLQRFTGHRVPQFAMGGAGAAMVTAVVAVV